MDLGWFASMIRRLDIGGDMRQGSSPRYIGSQPETDRLKYLANRINIRVKGQVHECTKSSHGGGGLSASTIYYNASQSLSKCGE